MFGKMATIRRIGWMLVLLAAGAMAQSQTPAEPHSPSPRPPDVDKQTWEYSLIVDGLLVEGEDGFVSPTLTADRDWLHLEARYNYENFRTGSLWVGRNFSWGKTWQFEVTPMIGGVFGRTNGIAPGCELTVSWKKLEFSLDNEYVFDTTSKSGNFYDAWPQLTFQPVKWFRFGGTAEHTKDFHNDFVVQKGFFIGFNHKKMEFTTYVFNPGSNSTSVALEVGATF